MLNFLGSLIHRTRWWVMLMGGAAALVALGAFTAIDRARVFGLMELGNTPAEKQAINNEILNLMVNEAGNVAYGFFTVSKAGALPWDRSKWEQAQERAQANIEKLRTSAGNPAVPHFSTHDTMLHASEGAVADAQTRLNEAHSARVGIEAVLAGASTQLHDSGAAASTTGKPMDVQLQAARQKEKQTQDVLDAMMKWHDQMSTPDVALSPAMKEKIHRSMTDYLRRFGAMGTVAEIFVVLFVMLLVVKFFIGRRYLALQAQAVAKGKEFRDVNAQRQLTEARLQSLQAQVEPHYLYNTLANVQALTETNPSASNQMLGHLIQYLRAALPGMRTSSSTIGQELERVRAYLNILKMRMGDRLAFDIHVNDELLTLPLPPMMLPTLVENAVKHGLEPKGDGGRIDVSISREQRNNQDCLRVQVSDTGAGLSEQQELSGSGIGLSNLRERLRALYGDDARFTLESKHPTGAVATLDIPLQIPDTVRATTVRSDYEPMQHSVPEIQPYGVSVANRSLRMGVVVALRSFIILTLLLVAYGLHIGWFPTLLYQLRSDGFWTTSSLSRTLLITYVLLPIAIGTATVVVFRFGMGTLLAGLLLLFGTKELVESFPLLSPLPLLCAAYVWYLNGKSQRTTDASIA